MRKKPSNISVLRKIQTSGEKMKTKEYYQKLLEKGVSSELKETMERELVPRKHVREMKPLRAPLDLYEWNDIELLVGYKPELHSPLMSLQTLDELLERDKKREEDGFQRRIRIGKIVKPGKGGKEKIVIVPTTTEPKLYHDNSVTTDGSEGATGGSGEGEEGEVIGEQKAVPQEGAGEGTGAGQGEGAEHDIGSRAFDLGRVLTERFELPNLKRKGSKRSFATYTYELTDRNRGFGQVLDIKATMKRIVETNILLGNINLDEPFSPEDFLLAPRDHVYRILSKEKDFESQAVVFFLRDYSGSMDGKPTEVVSTQHLFIYSWLVYQYQNRVETRFILHDTEAKTVPDFQTYQTLNVAGGTRVAPAFRMVNKIVEEERLASDYNIYVFHGTDGDDWDSDGRELIEEIKKMSSYVNRIGISVARNSWSGGEGSTTVEKSIEKSGLLREKPEMIRMDSMPAAEVSESRIIEGIKKLVS